MTGSGNSTSRVAYLNARLLDPESGLDEAGALLTEGTRIADFGPRLFNEGLPEGVTTVDCGGACLAPGLVDLRVQPALGIEQAGVDIGDAGPGLGVGARHWAAIIGRPADLPPAGCRAAGG